MIIPLLMWIHVAQGSRFTDKLSVQNFPSSEVEKVKQAHLSYHLGDK